MHPRKPCFPGIARVACSLALLGLSACVSVRVDETPSPSDPTSAPKPEAHVRYTKDAAGEGLSFDCLSREYTHPKTGKRVTVVGMVHLGDPSFYKRVREKALAHDRVLCEGVTGGDGVASLPTIYLLDLGPRAMGSSRLHFQTTIFKEEDARRFRNADVSLEELNQSVGDVLGSWVSLPFGMVLGETAVALIGTGELACTVVGQQDAYGEGMRDMLAGSLGGGAQPSASDPIILDFRNEHLLKILDEELAKPEVRSVMLPWGAAHHRGVEKGLIARGFVAGAEEWIPAFKVKDFAADDEVLARLNLPYVLRVEHSPYVTSWSGPLGLVSHAWTHDSAVQSLGWGLVGYRKASPGHSIHSLLGPVGWTRSERLNEDRGRTSALLGLYDHRWNKDSATTEYGWWGVLGGHSESPDADAWTLPLTFGRFPLLYGQRTEDGVTSHRFLLFFDVKTSDEAK